MQVFGFKRCHLLLLSILVGLAACGPAKQPAAEKTSYLTEVPAIFPLVGGVAGPDDIGRFLAGRPVHAGAGLSRLQQTAEYQIHQREMAALWRIAGTRMNEMRAWSARELTPVIGGGATVLYPFGGPDLLYVSAMFPQARDYALIGLEPVGEVAALEALPPGEVLAALSAFREITRTQLAAGYFVTKDMRAFPGSNILRGVTPILLSTVALSGGRVDAVSSLSASGLAGVEVRFHDAAGVRHRAWYVAGDLSNSGFGGGCRKWLAGLGGNVSYFKAASYLMHDAHFSQARDFFLQQSRVILQDDSGIPLRYFSPAWEQHFFGKYEHPIELFAKFQQNDLRQAYAAQPSAALEFGTGYQVNQWQGNLLLAVKH